MVWWDSFCGFHVLRPLVVCRLRNLTELLGAILPLEGGCLGDFQSTLLFGRVFSVVLRFHGLYRSLFQENHLESRVLLL